MPASIRSVSRTPIANRRSARSRSVTFADVATRSFGRFGIGGDVTGYLVPDNLKESYGSPWSFHVFLRYHGRFGARLDHSH